MVQTTNYQLKFSFTGDVGLDVNTYVFQYNKNNEYLGRKSFSKSYDIPLKMKNVIIYLLEAKTKINPAIYVK